MAKVWQREAFQETTLLQLVQAVHGGVLYSPVHYLEGRAGAGTEVELSVPGRVVFESYGPTYALKDNA